MIAILLSIVFSVHAQQTLQVAFGLERKPFVYEKTTTGIVQNIFNETIQNLNLKLKISHLPNFRLRGMLEQNIYDIIVEVHNLNAKKNKNYFYSDKFIAYYNYSVSKNVEISSYKDMANRAVCAWQNAKESLGNEFLKEQSNFKSYREFPEQEEQVLAYVRGQCDVLIIDRDIFTYYSKNILNNNRLLAERSAFTLDTTKYNPLPTGSELWWYVAFKSKSLRDQFNVELKKLKESGRYKYLRETAIPLN